MQSLLRHREQVPSKVRITVDGSKYLSFGPTQFAGEGRVVMGAHADLPLSEPSLGKDGVNGRCTARVLTVDTGRILAAARL